MLVMGLSEFETWKQELPVVADALALHSGSYDLRSIVDKAGKRHLAIVGIGGAVAVLPLDPGAVPRWIEAMT